MVAILKSGPGLSGLKTFSYTIMGNLRDIKSCWKVYQPLGLVLPERTKVLDFPPVVNG